jgi:hypothetical protein
MGRWGKKMKFSKVSEKILKRKRLTNFAATSGILDLRKNRVARLTSALISSARGSFRINPESASEHNGMG